MTEYELRTHLPDLSAQEAELCKSPPFKPFGAEDAKVLALARWFKSSYMRWVDPIKCPQCGGATHGAGGVQPDDVERKGGAGRVEVHICMEGCGGLSRFPRYNNVQTLLSTREGRCGGFPHLEPLLRYAQELTIRRIRSALLRLSSRSGY